jgi:antitoxin component HigA of HigAB toxin-antitoxin module
MTSPFARSSAYGALLEGRRGSLVEAHESKHFPIDLPDPVDAIRFSA